MFRITKAELRFDGKPYGSRKSAAKRRFRPPSTVEHILGQRFPGRLSSVRGLWLEAAGFGWTLENNGKVQLRTEASGNQGKTGKM